MTEEVLIRNILDQNKSRYARGLSDSDCYEIFVAEAVLKRFGLTYDEIEAGIVDGQNDGGIDSVYFFANRVLIAPDSDLSVFKAPVDIDLFIIQSKYEKKFSESAMAHLIASLPTLMKLSANSSRSSGRFNNGVLEKFDTYRKALAGLASQFPAVNVHIIYSTIANQPNRKVSSMAPPLETAVTELYPNSKCIAELWDAKRLYSEAKKQNVFTKKLPYTKQPISHGKGFIILTTLSDYYSFVTDNGNLISSLFEFNVRDYHKSAAVNKEISATLLNSSDLADFWWLNNGVTILAEKASAQDNAATIRNPIIVNGLQTSHEIYRFFASGGKDSRDRCIQVRVLEIEDDETRDRVIKSTNSQTRIKQASLHATEPLQRKIEDYLQKFNIFYDRRKDFWRNKGKPVDRIIGIDRLAQSAIAILLERPQDARARPTTIMQDEALYKKIFSGTHDFNTYRVCAELYFLAKNYLNSIRKNTDQVYTNNLLYHLIMHLAWRLNGSRPAHPAAVCNFDTQKLTESDIEDEFAYLKSLFDDTGPGDNTAKDSDFTEILKKQCRYKTSRLGHLNKNGRAKKILK